jgi:multiple sugar transport system permease protein
MRTVSLKSRPVFWRRPIPDEWRSPNFWRETGWAYVYLLPSLVILGIFVFYPFFSAFRLSVYKVSFVNFPGTFVGMDHFRYIFTDKYFWRALWHTAYFVGVNVPVTLFIALLVATLLNKALRFRTFGRVSFYLGYITPLVAIVMVWRLMYNWQYGLLNYFLGFFGVSLINWLNKPQFALPAVIIMNVWRYVGYEAIILLAGLQAIDKMYYEAARIDGASGFQVWRKVTLPLLTPQIFFVLIISLIGSFKVFTEIHVLFTGSSGPLKSAETLVYYIMRQGFFGTPHYGRAAAASIILFIIIFLVTLFQLRVTQKRVHYQ